MSLCNRFVVLFILLVVLCSSTFPQAENVPTVNPVYLFLKRMEVKGIIGRYHDAILPLSRGQISEFLVDIKEKADLLTEVERNQLRDLYVEFQYDIDRSREGVYNILDFSEPGIGPTANALFSEREKCLYSYADSNASLFVDGLLTVDARRSTGDALGGANAEFAQFGGRIRGTIYGKLGYYMQGTNALFRGSRDVLLRDTQLNQSYTLANVFNTSSFDFSEGSVRYDARILSLQVGQERILWGNGYGTKLILSDNPRVFPFVRADAEYKSLKYTFVHAWLLGTRSSYKFLLPPETTSRDTLVEPLNADKYLAAHRLELSFPALFDVGFQEVLIYSNRSVDLAYLNPAILLESAQRSRDERDNNFWAVDIQTHFLKNVEFQGTVDFDDINFSNWGSNSWENRYAYQLGAMATDPLWIPNTTIAVEYTRVQPYTFSHGRSRDNSYGSDGRILGTQIGPNADSWFLRIDHMLTHRIFASIQAQIQRNGENVNSSSGVLLRNVGGDFLQPHRDSDSTIVEFLDGNLVRTFALQAQVSYQIVRQIFVDARYMFTRQTDSSLNNESINHDFGVALRFDY